MVQLLKTNTKLFTKVSGYINWRYRGTRSICFVTIDNSCRIKATTRCHKKDHYPTKTRKSYRVRTMHTEYVNQYQMNDLYRTGGFYE